MAEVKIMKKNKKRGSLFFKIFTLAFVCCILFLLFFYSPIFLITNVVVSGNEKYTKDEVCSKINLKKSENLFQLNKSYAKKLLMADPYIKNVDIKRKLPDTIIIKVKERKVRGYVPYMGTYLFIDEEGRVLDVQDYFVEMLPVVEGLEFNKFKLGELLEVNNPKSFEVVVKLAQLMLKYELLKDVVKVDVKNDTDIHLHINSVDVMIGDFSDGDEKIRRLVEIIKNIPKEDKGFLDIKDINKPYIFTFLT